MHIFNVHSQRIPYLNIIHIEVYSKIIFNIYILYFRYLALQCNIFDITETSLYFNIIPVYIMIYNSLTYCGELKVLNQSTYI